MIISFSFILTDELTQINIIVEGSILIISYETLQKVYFYSKRKINRI